MFEKETPEWRIAAAKRTMKRVIDHAVDLIWINESNAVTLYSDTLVKQIPRSYAAHAFNVFRKAMHQMEIVRLCALWDIARNSLQRESIPTVVELIDQSDVLERLCETARAQYAPVAGDSDGKTENGSDVEVVNFYHAKAGKKYAERARAELRTAIDQARNLEKSERLKAMRVQRNVHVAHNLTEEAKYDRGVVESIKYGDERIILDETISIITPLYSWINRVGISFQASRNIDKKCVEALWHNCKFSIEPERSRQGLPP